MHNHVADRTLRQLKTLSRQRDDLRALVDTLPDPLLLADTRRRVIRINRPACELFGVAADRALGEPLEAAVGDPAVLSLFDAAAKIDADQTDAGRQDRAAAAAVAAPQPRRAAAGVPGRRHPQRGRGRAGGPARHLHARPDPSHEKRLRRQRRPRAAHAHQRDQGRLRDAGGGPGRRAGHVSDGHALPGDPGRAGAADGGHAARPDGPEPRRERREQARERAAARRRDRPRFAADARFGSGGEGRRAGPARRGRGGHRVRQRPPAADAGLEEPGGERGEVHAPRRPGRADGSNGATCPPTPRRCTGT